MPRLALISNLDGCGRTSLAVHLASAFVERGRRVLALECDPANLLGLHLGLEQAPERGWASLLQEGRPWTGAALQNSEGVVFLPFGSLAPAALAGLEATLAREPCWLADELAAVPDLADALVLLDTPALPSPFARQALGAADFVLVVLEADGRSLVQLPVLQAWLDALARGRPHAVLVNRLDSSLPLERDFLAVLQQRLGERFLPYPVHRDEAVRLAFACCVSLCEGHPHSQALRDLAGVAGWLEAQPALAGARP
ncbi:cellulose biosynthesis protein BcsQ [Azovibrio restrictus]|uniref:cellulose biosynthesis protein BcsQ n=1 Tax=Azovibrio restrictus TaxID=146938 RepID=UPI0026F2246F|nr:cellulose biosynthesis protein BcsQ [Azovibrio restrictus]